ncbi:TetR/AcrR family transcriptional regulator [Spongiactinospora sp. 9N601]|uniref:TetR/AcrR family transcriptional regulator n=1 Tax=Spongiactinospora sp. 9N601 TaxID=3375149 RepID=UPI00378CEAE1
MDERADRILDAARGLILRLGYRKVTVEDIAAAADVGKGTVYLHWRTKHELYEALLLREAIWLIEDLIAMLRRDPATVRPSTFARESYLATVRRPLLFALFTGDVEYLGKLARHPLRSHDLLASDRFFAVVDRFGLTRQDIPHREQTVSAVSASFYLLDAISPDTSALTPEDKADALAFTMRNAFEPAGEPDPDALAAAAAEYIAIFEELIPPYRKWIYD